LAKSNTAKKKKQPVNKPFVWLSALVGAGVLAVILTVSGFAFAAFQESHDSFCASCHTQPESTFYQRSQGAAAVDMASVHTAKDVRCIDCHSGSGLTGRISAELMGARNAAMWYSGTAVQPAKLTVPVGDENCLKCHQQTVDQGRGRNNHFHFFLARWQAQDPNATGCVSCHGGHNTDGNAGTRFMSEVQVQMVCDACHQVLRQEGG
jgi:hypothetical protein